MGSTSNLRGYQARPPELGKGLVYIDWWFIEQYVYRGALMDG